MINNLGPRYADHASSKFNLLQKKYSRRYTATNKVFKLSTTFEISARVFIATFQANSKSCQDCKVVQREVYHLPLYNKHLKAPVVLYAFEESVDCHLLSSFCNDSNLHISLFKYVLSTMGVSKESISKCLE